ncbi:DUF2306 domain-containing protein [Cellulomonas cellasea]|uniref:Putative membrane protein n=1 Tax=Cellulomonas cellasea TaxID=43670 RepID=A0A7W4UGZ5_9CELL|nr:DUF2306 domain-containing protein [Cellulomonas cellasea]MBB2923991.1 putative membrane protein [Cellulomonas cellasea]
MTLAPPLTPRPRPRPRLRAGTRRSRAGLVTVAVLAAAIALVSVVLYASGSLAALAEEGVGLASTYAGAPGFFRLALYAHIGSASLALASGPAQFSARLRRRFPRGHRVVGRTYLGSVALGALTGLLILPVNSAGWAGVFGFGALASLWGWTGWNAYRSIRAGDVAGHRSWVFRNYALTFAAVTLRLWTVALVALSTALGGVGADPEALFQDAYLATPFLCWLPNLLVAERLVRRRGLPSYRLVAAPAPARA